MKDQKDITIFENEKGITAGFTVKPARAEERRAELVEEAKAAGGLVVRPRLVHGSRVEVIDEARLDVLAQTSSFSEGCNYV